MRRVLRLLGTLLIVGGIGMLVWTVVVWRWQDPFTAAYTRYEQHRLAQSYERRLSEYRAPHYPPALSTAAPKKTPAAPKGPTGPTLVEAQHDIRLAARRYRLSSHEGEAIGRIVVKRLGLNMILVDGTDTDTLKKGPGRFLGTYMPGEGQLIYIAGHRTTYLAPFSHIDKLRSGDIVTLSMPYGTFTYRITHHVIVPADDLAVLRTHGREVVALQACHPRFFATHRYIAYASLVSFALPDGHGYAAAAAAPLHS
jgi:sortase A